MNNSVQFGRARQSLAQRWLALIAFAGWCLMLWVFHESAAMIGNGLVIATFTYLGERNFNRAARIEPGVAILRTGRREQRVPAAEITDIQVVETPGWLTRSVYVRLHRGKFNSFDVLSAKAPNTPDGRQRLQAKVDEAIALLRRAA